MKTKVTSLLLIVTLLFTLGVTSASAASTEETLITLSDNGILVNGSAASTDSTSSVYTGAQIVYYEAGKGSSYGEGTSADEHSAVDAAQNTVVTITKPGTYRVSGTLSKGQLAIDLGENAKSDPNAVVNLILDNASITCTVAPAVIFYNVYESGTKDTATATHTVDTTKAGANVILADGSKNYVDGSYVARIYKEGSTKKLHKYDGAFYSKMSMNISGGNTGTGELHIKAANEGLDSELHLTINSGNIWIEAQNDGINTNEDDVSVTTINGGYLYVNGGLGAEGDGIDSNGYLVINGGTVVSMANPRTGDGGIDADKGIYINGGTVIATGSRNDAVNSSSKQAYMELSYATTQAANSILRIEDAQGKELLTFSPVKQYQSVTFSSADLTVNSTYHVYAGGTMSGATAADGLYAKGGVYTAGTQQQYTGNSSGMMRPGGSNGQGQRPTGQKGERPEMPSGQAPEGLTPPSGERPKLPNGEAPTMPEGMTAPEGFDPGANGGFTGELGSGAASSTTAGSVDFTLTAQTRSFSGVSNSVTNSGKTAVTFSINGGKGMTSVATGKTPVLSDILVKNTSGTTQSVPSSDVQITVTDVPSKSYSKTALLSDGVDAIAKIMPTADGAYQLTISVSGQNAAYNGTSLWQFNIGGLPYTDITQTNKYYDAVKFVSEAGYMNGVDTNTFAANTAVNRAMAITILGRVANAQAVESKSFTDVASGSYYAPYVGWATKNNVVSGYGNGQFGPSNSVTREQMAVMLYNYAKAFKIELPAGNIAYTDASSIAAWATDAVAACTAAKLFDGVVTGNSFSPTSALTRGELAQIMMQFAALK